MLVTPLYLTIKSIIDNNVWDFHVCLIDDDSFSKLLPKWQVPMNDLEETALSKYRKLGLGSAIFIHLTKNYIPTAGCIGLAEKDFLILIKLIKKNTFIKIL